MYIKSTKTNFHWAVIVTKLKLRENLTTENFLIYGIPVSRVTFVTRSDVGTSVILWTSLKVDPHDHIPYWLWKIYTQDDDRVIGNIMINGAEHPHDQNILQQSYMYILHYPRKNKLTNLHWAFVGCLDNLICLDNLKATNPHIVHQTASFLNSFY